MDTKHKMLLNNYHVIAVGVLDAAQQFNLVTLAVSNKEDSYLFESFLRCIKTDFQKKYGELDITATMSDNCNAIQSAFHAIFPDCKLGNCLYHLITNNKKNRE